MTNIQSSYVVLYRNEFEWKDPMTWLSAAIRWFTKFKCNHAAVSVSSWGVLMLNEALASGVVSRPLLAHLKRSHSKVIILKAKIPLDEETFCRRANSMLGVGYDYKFTFLDEAWYWLRRRFNKNAKYTGHTAPFADKKFACAEYVAWCHNRPYWYSAAPVDLYNDSYFEVVYDEVYRKDGPALTT